MVGSLIRTVYSRRRSPGRLLGGADARSSGRGQELIERGWVQGGWYVLEAPDRRRRFVGAGSLTRRSFGEIVQSCLVGAVVESARWHTSERGAAGPAIDTLWHQLGELVGGPPPVDPRTPIPLLRSRQVGDLTTWNDRRGRSREDAAWPARRRRRPRRAGAGERRDRGRGLAGLVLSPVWSPRLDGPPGRVLTCSADPPGDDGRVMTSLLDRPPATFDVRPPRLPPPRRSPVRRRAPRSSPCWPPSCSPGSSTRDGKGHLAAGRPAVARGVAARPARRARRRRRPRRHRPARADDSRRWPPAGWADAGWPGCSTRAPTRSRPAPPARRPRGRRPSRSRPSPAPTAWWSPPAC